MEEPDIHKYPMIGGTKLYLRDRLVWSENRIKELEKEIAYINTLLGEQNEPKTD